MRLVEFSAENVSLAIENPPTPGDKQIRGLPYTSFIY